MRILAFFVLFFAAVFPAQAQERDYTHFRSIPILDDGRVKPLESYARAYLKVFSSKETIEGMTARAWLAEILFDQEKAHQRRIFNVANPDVLYAIGLEWRDKHRYSFKEVSEAADRNIETLSTIYNMEQEQRTMAQQQLLELYFKIITYNEMSQALQYVHSDQIKDILNRQEQVPAFRIVPPQWNDEAELWSSPYATLVEGKGSPHSAAYMALWEDLGQDYRDGNAAAWLDTSLRIKDMAYGMTGAVSQPKQELEVLYHDLDVFKIALLFYLISFVALWVWFFVQNTPMAATLYRGSFSLITAAAVLQLIGIILRIIIMDRPPVSTLYETTIFVSLIAIITCLAFEWKKRDGYALIVAAVIGCVLLFVSMGYAAHGDTMEMLVAVLNTNFWLATHVVTITMGYGASIVAGTLAHVYLIKRYFQPQKDADHRSIFKMTIAVSLVALFFSVLGTILGGIWADQSWGRFWGWDPKENGAMLICLWLLWLLHGRITGLLQPLSFMTLMVGVNIIVALAWFGVNLLGVGLHSYGFTTGIARNLAVFCSIEAAFALGFYLLIRAQERKGSPA